MFGFYYKKPIFYGLITALLAVVSIVGVKTLASNDILVLAKLHTQGYSTWQTGNINVEPGYDVKINLFAGNYSQTAAVSNAVLSNNLPANTTFLTGTVFQDLANSGAWQALTDSGVSPFAGSGLGVTSDSALSAQEFANYKYTVHVDDFLPAGTTQLSWSGPVLNFTDTFGSQTASNINSNAITVQNLPSISTVALTPAQTYYKLGDVITVTVIGAPGKTASLKIGSITVNLSEAVSGNYTGSYTVQSGNNLSGIPRAYLANTNSKGAYKDYMQSITLDSTLPSAPSGLNAILNLDSSVKLIWLAPADVSDVNHYNIYSNNGTSNVSYASAVATVAVGTNQYTTAPLSNDALYKFSVRSVDNAGNIEANVVVVAKSTDVTPPEAPASLVQPTNLNSQVLKYNASTPIQFVWGSSIAADLAKYRLEIDDNSDFSSIIATQDTVGTTTSYSLTTATATLPAGIYYYRVSAVDDVDLVSTPTTSPTNSFEIDNVTPTVAVNLPVSGTHINTNFTESGTGADSGTHLNATTGINSVSVFLTNLSTGQHWNGTVWGATATFLTASTTDGFATWSYQFTASIANNSIYTTGSRIIDKAGNQTDSSIINLVGDTVAPTAINILPTNSTLGDAAIFKNTDSIVLTATINDNLGQGGMTASSVRADLSAVTGNAGDNAVAPAAYNSGTGVATWAAVVGNASSDGAKNIAITATDLAGNTSTTNGSITADNSLPAITAATLTSPSASGLIWAGGSIRNITWNQAQITDTNLAANPITLEYTTDGSNWNAIASSEANDGTYPWTLPAINSATVRVRLTAKDNANNTSSDQSDNLFTVDSVAPAFSNVVLTNSTLSIATLVKNGDTVLLTGTITDNLLQAGLTTASITANFTNITGNAGDNAVLPTSYNTADGAAVWNFKTTAGTTNGNLNLSITATDGAGNAATFTNTAIIVADNTAPAITATTLTAPSAISLTYAGASTQNITWNQALITDTNLNATPIKLEYSTDGSTYTLIANNEANDGTYAWTLPSINFQTVTVRLTATDQVALSATDVSNNNFTIDSTTPTVPANALTAPNGGEAWKQGTVKNITWNNGAITDNFALAANSITLEYTTDGLAWNPIATNEANDGTYAWTVPNIDFTTVKVRLTATDLASLAASDQSDANFSVGLPPVIVQARAMSNTLVQVEWDKSLSTAGAFASYTATGITATAAAINGGNNKIVDLTVNALNNTGFTAADLAVALNTATDTFNFQNEATSTVAIIDKQAPVVTIASSYPNSNQLIVDYSPAIRIAVSEAPGPTTVFKLDTIAQTTGYDATNKFITYNVAATLVAGKHTISLDMVDLAGNTAANQTYDFWIDNFTSSMTLAPVSFLFNGNVLDDGSGAEQQSITVSTFGAGYKVYAYFTPTVSDGAGNFINDMDIKLSTDPWANKIDLNGATQIQLASVAHAVTPSLTTVSNTYTYDLRANIPGVTQSAGNYNGTMQFIVVPEY